MGTGETDGCGYEGGVSAQQSARPSGGAPRVCIQTPLHKESTLHPFPGKPGKKRVRQWWWARWHLFLQFQKDPASVNTRGLS